ncbi:MULTISPECIES: cell division protein FtsL [unclassified Gemella]|uniref:cell division protein FtsL n=1 Tax=unclassified Gemella TaxID=2624949 RepID=UPI0010736072|nr:MULTISPECIES: cell division protein FtsL [unclassified Gemella]MBF0710014.1 cell division protein FtsL [Gemella sp. GL1.1]MBF0746093.1 cell division protein FtsL [Gemella sp. 19428wG2_WT2a]NYS27358.1 cell division protein FtsL [Gemella sp. GL1]TFU60384.1 cell division protein FtsL [Gemella sp. WT2a]
MATLKVYSREYGVKKIEEKVKLTKPELFIYLTIPITLFVSIYVMLSYEGELYSLKNQETVNSQQIQKIKNANEEQKVIINDLSSYDRIKNISEVLGMTSQKENIKVVR